MVPSVKPSRRYDATGRRAQAQVRRESVLRAASAQFLEKGYAATTVGAVAAAAGVSTETVYKVFGSKGGLVRALREQALQGADPVPAETRSDALHLSDDPHLVVRGWARLATEVAPRVVPVLLLVRDAAAGGDPEMRRLIDDLEADRRRRMADNAGRLAERGHLRQGVSRSDAADVLFAVSSPEMFELLVLRQRWSLERYGAFVEDTLAAALLAS